jgi:hypothetical protein
MSRVMFVLVAVFAAPALARAEILPTFAMGHCEVRASHVVVVDDAGKVLESWRGDLRPGDVLPVADFHLKAPPVSRFGKVEGAPEKISGKRMILFLTRGEPKFGRGLVVGSWTGANWFGNFDISTAWVEGGHVFVAEQFINPGPVELSHQGTEAEFKKQIVGVDRAVSDLFAKARAEKKLPERAKILADIVARYPGFAPAALAGLEWCGADAVPALRALVRDEKSPGVGDPELRGAYLVLGKLGEPSRDVLMEHLADQLRMWKDATEKIGNWRKLDEDEERMYRLLLAATAYPEALKNLKPDQLKTVRELRDLWATHEVLSKLGEKGDRVADRLDRLLPRGK